MVENNDKLKTNKLYIIKSCCDWIVPKEELDRDSAFIDYPVKIDYSVKSHEQSKSFSILIDIKINRENVRPGYSIYMEAMADFTITTDSSVKEQEKDYYINYIALVRCIKYARGFIASLTANYPLGKYYFDPINMTNLYNEHLERRKKIKQRNPEK